MDIKRLTEWLTTAEGTGKALTAILVVAGALIAAANKAFDAIGLPPWAVRSGVALVTLAFGASLLSSYRRFAVASRLERPDGFTVRPTGPDSLFGRNTDLDKLTGAIQHHLLVLLDGESGCGKSALILYGLIPRLKMRADGLLPVLIREWGDDWIRGPLAAALESLFQTLTPAERETLNWPVLPDLAANAATLALELRTRLEAAVAQLGRRPLLIADQFDDYQALHRHHFVEADGSWITPKALAQANPFWQLVSDSMTAGRLRLLVVTRSDMAAGTDCTRFVGEGSTTVRGLPRVEGVYLRPLLAAIAPPDMTPPVISNPEHGWNELRELLERDLKGDGAILMQQVRTVLLGVGQLGVLTPRAYRASGGVRGVEILVIARALLRASRAVTATIPIGDNRTRLDTARALLGTLVVSRNANRRPKARHAPFSVLNAIAGHRAADTLSMLRSLQDDGVVRPAAAVDGENAWQLDHDYLATAVLAEARAANRWSAALHEGRARYDEAKGHWRQQWRTLLPMTTLARLGWECVRGRLAPRTASRYLLMSAIKPLLLLICLTLSALAASAWNQDRILTVKATHVIDDLGTTHSEEAVMQVWSADRPLRQRVQDLVYADNARFERATSTRWPLADAGLERARVCETVIRLRLSLQHGPETSMSMNAATAYANLVPRLAQEDVRAEFLSWRTVLRDRRYFLEMGDLTRAFALLALRLPEEDVKTARTILLELLQDKQTPPATLYAYSLLAARSNPADARTQAVTLRQYIEHQGSPDAHVDIAARAYYVVAERLSDTDARIEAPALRHLMERIGADPTNRAIAPAYTLLATHLTGTAEKEEIAALHELMKPTHAVMTEPEVVQAYLQATAHLGEQDLNAEATTLRTLYHDTGFTAYADAYGVLVTRLNDAEAKSEVATLLAVVDGPHPLDVGPLLTRALPALARRLSPEEAAKAAATLRSRIDEMPGPLTVADLTIAYSDVATQLSDTEARSAIKLLAARLTELRPSDLTRRLVLTYATVAAKLSDADINKAVSLLSANILQQPREPLPLSDLIQTYSRLLPRLTPLQARETLAALSSRIGLGTDSWAAGTLTQLFDRLATRLDSTQAKAHAVQLRQLMERAGYFAPDFSPQYISTIARLTDHDLEMEAMALESHLAQEWNRVVVGRMTTAYAGVARQLLERRGDAVRRPLTLQALTLAGHPFLEDSAPLLYLLNSLSGKSFNGDLHAAATWAQQTYGVQPEQLRPVRPKP